MPQPKRKYFMLKCDVAMLVACEAARSLNNELKEHGFHAEIYGASEPDIVLKWKDKELILKYDRSHGDHYFVYAYPAMIFIRGGLNNLTVKEVIKLFEDACENQKNSKNLLD